KPGRCPQGPKSPFHPEAPQGSIDHRASAEWVSREQPLAVLRLLLLLRRRVVRRLLLPAEGFEADFAQRLVLLIRLSVKLATVSSYLNSSEAYVTDTNHISNMVTGQFGGAKIRAAKHRGPVEWVGRICLGIMRLSLAQATDMASIFDI